MLSSACQQGKTLSTIQAILADGFDINARDAIGQTALMVECGKAELRVHTLEYLVKHNAEVNARDATGQTALHMLLKGAGQTTEYQELCSTTALRLLIKKGVDVNAVDTMGNTPLLLALAGGRSSKFVLSTVERLLAAGALPNLENAAGARPITVLLASQQPDDVKVQVAQRLFAAGAKAYDGPCRCCCNNTAQAYGTPRGCCSSNEAQAYGAAQGCRSCLLQPVLDRINLSATAGQALSHQLEYSSISFEGKDDALCLLYVLVQEDVGAGCACVQSMMNNLPTNGTREHHEKALDVLNVLLGVRGARLQVAPSQLPLMLRTSAKRALSNVFVAVLNAMEAGCHASVMTAMQTGCNVSDGTHKEYAQLWDDLNRAVHSLLFPTIIGTQQLRSLQSSTLIRYDGDIVDLLPVLHPGKVLRTLPTPYCRAIFDGYVAVVEKVVGLGIVPHYNYLEVLLYYGAKNAVPAGHTGLAINTAKSHALSFPLLYLYESIFQRLPEGDVMEMSTQVNEILVMVSSIRKVSKGVAMRAAVNALKRYGAMDEYFSQAVLWVTADKPTAWSTQHHHTCAPPFKEATRALLMSLHVMGVHAGQDVVLEIIKHMVQPMSSWIVRDAPL